MENETWREPILAAINEYQTAVNQAAMDGNISPQMFQRYHELGAEIRGMIEHEPGRMPLSPTPE